MRPEAVVRPATLGARGALRRTRPQTAVPDAVRGRRTGARRPGRYGALALPGAGHRHPEPVSLPAARVPAPAPAIAAVVHVDLPWRPEHAERPGGRARQHLRDRLLRDPAAQHRV